MYILPVNVDKDGGIGFIFENNTLLNILVFILSQSSGWIGTRQQITTIYSQQTLVLASYLLVLT